MTICADCRKFLTVSGMLVSNLTPVNACLETDILILRLSGDGVRPDPEKTQAVGTFLTPLSLKEVRSFL